ncbi:hypothetical protein V6N11_055284 [Hibiscus sabdariffa]|uniref:Uncharacterized protein n=1 Tax=Hibiscus sabdariffa TaxID=183260 RepID=A0ABR2PF01_9ROSI
MNSVSDLYLGYLLGGAPINTFHHASRTLEELVKLFTLVCLVKDDLGLVEAWWGRVSIGLASFCSWLFIVPR